MRTCELVRGAAPLVALLVACLLLPAAQLVRAQSSSPPKVVLAIHGGAGTIVRAQMNPEREAAYRAKLEEALRAGYAVLQEGRPSLDAVIAAIQVMEDSPLFNAGRGAVLTSEGTAELDASVMDGATQQAGAVAGVKTVKSPIALARLVMERSPHVMMVGAGAEAFGREQNVEFVPNEYFRTDQRKQQLENLQRREREGQQGAAFPGVWPDHKYGTVGAVALDQAGNLAAGTSTGGMTNKRFGRVGDAPIIGAGTYADNATCAISATGHGEYFIRAVVAYRVAAMMQYAGLGLAEAANAVIHGTLTELGGTGGIIALDRQGRVAMPFNTAGMYRGYVDENGAVTIAIYRD